MKNAMSEMSTQALHKEETTKSNDHIITFICFIVFDLLLQYGIEMNPTVKSLFSFHSPI